MYWRAYILAMALHMAFGEWLDPLCFDVLPLW